VGVRRYRDTEVRRLRHLAAVGMSVSPEFPLLLEADEFFNVTMRCVGTWSREALEEVPPEYAASARARLAHTITGSTEYGTGFGLGAGEW
jgi:hypothetical protein